MRTRSLVWVLLLLMSQASAQDPEDRAREESDQVDSPALTGKKEDRKKEDEKKNEEKPAPLQPAADFQPSEEIMADTMLTLPADI